ncbi:hypothetical protein GGI04_004660, partial [Coemansia thaxteri]
QELSAELYYTVILRSQNSGARHVLSVKRCRLNGEKKADETFVLHETEGGSVFRADYNAGKGSNCLKSPLADTPSFATKALVKSRVRGPTPELAIAASIDASTGKEKQPEPQKGFLAKYWYYLIPIVLLLMFSGEEPQQEAKSCACPSYDTLIPFAFHTSVAATMDLEIERELMEAQSTPSSESGNGQFDKMLQEAVLHIEGLMLVTVTDADRTVIFREALPVFHEPRFEEALIDKCYDAFDDIKKLHIGSSDVLMLFYGAMQVVQFRVGSYYGTIVCDLVSNMGLVHNLVNRIRECLKILAGMSNDTPSQQI